MEDTSNWLKVIDENGQIVNYIRPGGRIVYPKNKGEGSNKGRLGEDVQSWNLERFYKGNVEELKLINKELSVYESAFINYIAPYVGYEDCCIKHGNGIPLSFEDMRTICHMSKGKLSQVISSLRTKDILYKGVNTEGIQYFINPWLYCRGTRIQKVLATMFQSYKIKIHGNKRWGDMQEILSDDTTSLQAKNQ